MTDNRRAKRSRVKNNKSDSKNFFHDVAIESGIIGTILKNPEFIVNVDYITKNMFCDMKLATMYEITKDLTDSGVFDIDDFTILSKIEESGKYKSVFSDYETIELREWLSNLRLTGTQNSDEYSRRCKRLITLDYKRNTIEFLKDIEETIHSDEDKDINQLNYLIQERANDLSKEYIIESDVYLMSDRIHEIRAELDADAEDSGGHGVGFPSRFPTVNKYFTYEKSELILVAGRAKAGKSMWALAEAYHKLKEGVPVAIFDTELKTKLWVVRFISHYTGIKVRDVKRQSYRGDYEKEQLVEDAYEFLENAPFTHIYDPDWTIEKIEATAKILKKKIGLEFLIYDYIKANNVGALKIAEHAYLADVANALKNNVAGKLDIAVLAFAQLSPSEERIADSRKIERYASTICYWVRKTDEEIADDGKRAGNYRFRIAYNRLGAQHGENEHLNMVFEGDICSIKEAREQKNISDDFE